MLVLDRHVDLHLEAIGKLATGIASGIVIGTVEAVLEGASMARMPRVPVATNPASSDLRECEDSDSMDRVEVSAQ